MVGKRFFPAISLKNCVGRYSISFKNPVLKPKIEPYNKALEQVGVTSKEAMYLGNSPEDIIGANNAGLTSVACLWGVNPQDKQAIIDANPDYTINHPLELLQVLK